MLISAAASAQTRYVCFEHEHNKNLQLVVAFDKNNKARYVRYKGQKDSLVLVHSSYHRSKNPDGGIPAYYWSESYLQKYKGKVTGEYVFTNAGTYALDLTYTRNRDQKEFYFMVNEDSLDSKSEDGPYRTRPCF
jgi:hypothetical protein